MLEHLISKFSGSTCRHCRKPIRKGSRIAWGGDGVVYHRRCEPFTGSWVKAAPPPDLEPRKPVNYMDIPLRVLTPLADLRQ